MIQIHITHDPSGFEEFCEFCGETRFFKFSTFQHGKIRYSCDGCGVYLQVMST